MSTLPIIVNVWDLDGHYLGEGLMEEVFGDAVPDDYSAFSKTFGHPRITLDNGTILYGEECWWKQKQENPPEQLDFTPLQKSINTIFRNPRNEKK